MKFSTAKTGILSCLLCLSILFVYSADTYAAGSSKSQQRSAKRKKAELKRKKDAKKRAKLKRKKAELKRKQAELKRKQDAEKRAKLKRKQDAEKRAELKRKQDAEKRAKEQEIAKQARAKATNSSGANGRIPKNDPSTQTQSQTQAPTGNPKYGRERSTYSKRPAIAASPYAKYEAAPPQQPTNMKKVHCSTFSKTKANCAEVKKEARHKSEFSKTPAPTANRVGQRYSSSSSRGSSRAALLNANKARKKAKRLTIAHNEIESNRFLKDDDRRFQYTKKGFFGDRVGYIDLGFQPVIYTHHSDYDKIYHMRDIGLAENNLILRLGQATTRMQFEQMKRNMRVNSSGGLFSLHANSFSPSQIFKADTSYYSIGSSCSIRYGATLVYYKKKRGYSNESYVIHYPAGQYFNSFGECKSGAAIRLYDHQLNQMNENFLDLAWEKKQLAREKNRALLGGDEFFEEQVTYDEDADESAEALNICAGEITGNYAKMANFIKRKMKAEFAHKYQINVVHTNGSWSNLENIKSRDCDIAFAQADAIKLYDDMQNEEVLAGFAEMSNSILSFGRNAAETNLIKESAHLFCHRNYGFNNLNEIAKAKATVAIGMPGSGSEITWKTLAKIDRGWSNSGIANITGLAVGGTAARDEVLQGRAHCFFAVSSGNSKLINDIKNHHAKKLQLIDVSDTAFKLSGIYQKDELTSDGYAALLPKSWIGHSNVETVATFAQIVVNQSWQLENDGAYRYLTELVGDYADDFKEMVGQ